MDKNLYKAVFAKLQNPVILLDPQAQIIDLNPAAQDILGARPGSVFWEHTQLKGDLDQILQTRVPTPFQTHLVQGGTITWQVSLLTNPQGEIEALLLAGETTGEHPKELWLRLDSLEITGASPSSHWLLGHPPSELEGRSISSFIYPEDLPRVVEVLSTCLVQRCTGRIEFRAQHAHGGHIWLEALISPQDQSLLLQATEISARKRAQAMLVKLNETFHKMGTDTLENIKILVEACGELLEADAALYNRLSQGLLVALGEWQVPAGHPRSESARGHICFDLIHGSLPYRVLRNLGATKYATTDPNIARYGIDSYIGHQVQCFGQVVGSLCLCYQQDVDPGQENRTLLGIIARAIGIEEERRQAQVILEAHEERLRHITDNMLDMVTQTDAEGVLVYASPSNQMVLGYDLEIAMGRKIFELVHPEDRERAHAHFLECVENATSSRCEFRYRHAQGHYVWLESIGNPIIQEGKVTGCIFGSRDITERRLAEEERQRLARHQSLLLNNIETQIWYLKDPYTYGVVNRAHAEFLGVDAIGIEGRRIADVLERKRAREYLDSNLQVFNEKRLIRYEKWVPDSTGRSRLLDITKIPNLDATGAVESLICTAVDITERKQVEEELRYLSFHDKLTGLYNRAYFDQELQRLDDDRNLPLSIIMGDVNGLKLVNDAFGHHHGDRLLERMAHVLRQACRRGDIISRWGGDEFIILLPGVDHQLAKKIRDRIQRICHGTRDQAIPLRIALGVASKEKPGEKMTRVLKQAEDRMYRNKLAESQSTRSSIISSLTKTLQEKSPETEAHASRLRELVAGIGRELGLSDSELDDLSLLASLHDIGKVSLPREILNKPGPLTPKEWDEVRKHSEVGYRIASAAPDLLPIAEGILRHHERWDGTGYPGGLAGEKIPIISRVLAVADSYDVMTHGRPYKAAMSQQEAFAEILRGAGTQFDPQVAQAFIKYMGSIALDLAKEVAD